MSNIIYNLAVSLDERVYHIAMRQHGWRYRVACKANHAAWKLRAYVEARVWASK